MSDDQQARSHNSVKRAVGVNADISRSGYLAIHEKYTGPILSWPCRRSQ